MQTGKLLRVTIHLMRLRLRRDRETEHASTSVKHNDFIATRALAA